MNRKIFIAEFVGTFALCFIGIGAIVMEQKTGALGLTGIALAHGLAIACFASATAATSGGHLNPAVSFAMWGTGRLTLTAFVGYVAAQVLGAVLGTAAISFAAPAEELYQAAVGMPAMSVETTVLQALVAEIVATFFLVFVVFGTAVDSRAAKAGGLYIGLAVTMGILATGPISGGAMNPARHFGSALLGGGFEHAWVYWVGPMTGGLLAGLVYHHLIHEPKAA